MQDNLLKKYNITADELKRAVDQIQFGKIACDGAVLVALCELIVSGDIHEEPGALGPIKGKVVELNDTELAILDMALNHLICDDLEEIDVCPDAAAYNNDRIARSRALRNKLNSVD